MSLETARNGTEIRDWKDRCYAYVQEDIGLDICHQGLKRNETRINEFIKSIQEQGCPEFEYFEDCTRKYCTIYPTLHHVLYHLPHYELDHDRSM